LFTASIEALVLRRVDAGGVPAAGEHADRLVTHRAQDPFRRGGHAAQDRQLESVFLVLPQEAETVGAGEAGIDRIDVLLELRKIGAVVGYIRGGKRRFTTRPPLSSNTRWNAAAVSWPYAKSSAMIATRL